MRIGFSNEEKMVLIKEIQDFFYEEREEKIGIIAAENILDFFLGNLGIRIYNKALNDARVWFSKRMEDLEMDYDLLYKYEDKRSGGFKPSEIGEENDH